MLKGKHLNRFDALDDADFVPKQSSWGGKREEGRNGAGVAAEDEDREKRRYFFRRSSNV